MAQILACAGDSRAPVTRVIAGTLYERTAEICSFDLRVHDLGHGHVEATALPRYAWREVGPLTEQALADYETCQQLAPAPTHAELLDKMARNRERARQRARSQVRRLCKAKGLAVMVTLTYRENMTDRERMARDFDAFMKRVRRAIPDLEYVCVFERQKRGAWHAHIAVPRILAHYVVGRGERRCLVKSYDLLRSMWRGVVGLDNGNIDVSRGRRVQRSTAKLAAYLAKYIGKSSGDGLDKWANSYSASGRALPDCIKERVLTDSQTAAISALFDLIAPEVSARGDLHHAVLNGGGYYLCLSPPAREKRR